MANQAVFKSASLKVSNKAVNTVNNAGGKAYRMAAAHELAQLAMTGTFNDTFYVSAATQLERAKALCAEVSPLFIAQLAVYARQCGYMKDLPAYLLAHLSTRDSELFAKAFPLVVDNGKMLRNFVQIMRSGQAGRKSLGSRPKAMVKRWIEAANESQILAASVGNSPSLADVIRLSHPAARDSESQALFSWVLGAKHEASALPALTRQLLAFRKDSRAEMPRVPFELLTSCELTEANWKQIARNASWTQTRMNLNTFARHGVFKDSELVSLVANRLTDANLIAKTGVFPYQLMAAFLNRDDGLPRQIQNALQDAMELAVAQVPSFDCQVAVAVDTSGSMSSSVTGNRGSASSKVRCIDVAALFASVVLRKNQDAVIVPFDTTVHTRVQLNERDSIMTNAQRLAALGGGGTNCSCALAHLNTKQSLAKLVVYVSDNESWADRQSGRLTGMMAQWELYKRRVPDAKLVCIDITPNSTTQARDRKDILNVGGFSDEVFRIVDLFSKGQLGGEHWVKEIGNVVLG